MANFNEAVEAQTKLYKRIRDYYTNFYNTYKKSMNSGKVEARIQTLNESWDQFRKDDRILQGMKDAKTEAHPYFTAEAYSLENVQETYTDTLGEFFALRNHLLKQENPPVAPQVTLSPTDIPQGQASAVIGNAQTSNPLSHLPRIPLPTFDGDQFKWESFKEIFKARVVDNNSLDNVLKLEQLLSCLQGEASRRLSGLPIVAANFNVAWTALTNRYDNRRLRLATHLNRCIMAPPVNPKSPPDLNRLLDMFAESKRALTALERPVEHWDDWFVQLMVSKLDYHSRNDWEKSLESLPVNDFPTYEALTKFLENRARTQEASRAFNSASQAFQKGQNPSSSSTNHKKTSNGSVSAHSVNTEGKQTPPNCKQCNQTHFMSRCPKFLELSVAQRRASLSSSGSCYNCLSGKHQVAKCQSKFNCRTCQGRHHTLIHPDSSGGEQKSSDAFNGSPPQISKVSACTTSVGGRALMATALVNLCSDANTITVRALIDPGADESFVTEHVAQALQLQKSPITTTISGVGGENLKAPTSLVAVTVKSRYDESFSMKLPALVLKKLTNLLPSAQVQKHDWPHIQGLQLADPSFHKPGRIDCILGAEVYGVIMRDGLRTGSHPSPTAQKTVFGWILIGSIESPSNCNSRVSCHRIQTEPLQDQLKKFWETEETPEVIHLTPEEIECEEHFQNTHSRDPDGRLIVRLPFNDVPDLPGSREIAISRFLSLEKRLQADPQLYTLYKKFMQEYLDLGHMERIPDGSTAHAGVYYIPHHGILKLLDKIRVVFNASQRARNGKSLNDFLHVGPKLQANLSGILTNWRFFRYVFTTDIVKMFRQFMIHPEDANWQRILWRSSPDQPLQEYRLLTVTYGTAPAPYLAIRCLQQLASDEAKRYPSGADMLMNHSYVDDNLGGGHELDTTIKTRDELVQILESAGMKLDKWAANDVRLIPSSHTHPTEELTFDDPISTLGLKWKPQEDYFQFKVTPKENPGQITKRSMLSEIASLFDPMGWLAPIIIKAKVYIQELWLRSRDWDIPVDNDLREAWIIFKQELSDIEKIQIPRWLFTPETPSWELHGFSDASERAYAAVIYLVTYSNNTYRSILISAKTKVAPVKKLSIPRLELCGAHLLAKLIKSTISYLKYKPAEIYCWSDSTTTLAWIRGGPTRWTTFVANRVSDILTLAPEAKWDHVNGSENPADLATRGATPVQLQDSSLWWNGPDWLLKGSTSWPKVEAPIASEEEKKANVKIFQSSVENTSFFDWLNRYSSLNKSIKMISFLFKWKRNSKLPKETERDRTPSIVDFSAAKLAIVKATQRHYFKDDIKQLEKGKSLSLSSPLRSLVPFLSPDGVLRVGGRLQRSSISYDEKHPPIIPKRCHLASLLIRDTHARTLHGGA